MALDRRVVAYARAVVPGCALARTVEVRQLPPGENHEVYVAVFGAPGFDRTSVVVRVGSSQRARDCATAGREAAVLASLGGVGAPRLYDFRCSSEWFEVPTMCMQFVDGQQRPPATAADFLSLGVVVGRVHDHSVDPGAWDDTPATGTDYLASRVEKIGVRLAVIDDHLPSAVTARLRRAAGLTNARLRRALQLGVFRADDPLVLLHGDVAGGNILWSPEPVLIDWEYARIGDAADEIAYVFSQNDCTEAQRRAFWRGYGDASTHSRSDLVGRVRWWEPVTVLGSAFFWAELWARRADADAVGRAATSSLKEQPYYRDRTLPRLDRVEALLESLPVVEGG